MHFVYILLSTSSNRYYCGQTNNLHRRVKQHNDPEYRGSLTTKRFTGPWVLIWEQHVADRGEAMMLERKIKKRGIGRFLAAQPVESRQRRD